MKAALVRGLAVIGALALALGLAVIALVGVSLLGPVEFASTNDVRFVLNWGKLGHHTAIRMIHSYRSERAFGGDHLDAYMFVIDPVDAAELSGEDPAWGGIYVRGDRLSGVVNDAVTLYGRYANGGTDEILWLPREREVRTADWYIYAVRFEYSFGVPRRAQLIFVRPGDDTVVYFSGKT